jgi:hypothetical protein
MRRDFRVHGVIGEQPWAIELASIIWTGRARTQGSSVSGPQPMPMPARRQGNADMRRATA